MNMTPKAILAAPRALLILLVCLMLTALPVQAIESFTVKDIKVTGAKRIGAGTIFNYLTIEVGDRIDNERVSTAIRSLYNTGFFEDVRLSRSGATLIVYVKERPTIGEIKVKGSKKLSEEKILKRIAKVGLALGRPFDRSLMSQMMLELKRQYYSEGHYAVRIDADIKPLSRNRVALNLKISEGRVAFIKDIRIIGNKAFSDSELRAILELRRHRDVINPFSKRDRYSKQEMLGDRERLRNFYLDRGYIDFAIESMQVSLSADKESVYITINISEGKPYRISGTAIIGDTAVPEKEIQRLIVLKKGELFSRKRVSAIISKISERLGEDGYAFARININPEIDREAGTVKVNFTISPGKRVYVRRISIFGNSVTRDGVIRRELRQLEGSWLSKERLGRSRTRLQRLGFFESVEIETPVVPGSTDQVDVVITVKERPTGSLMAGAGYSDANGLFISLGYNERNVFGTGKDVTLNYDDSQTTTVYDLRYTNPYYTMSGISRGFELYSRFNDATAAGVGKYSTLSQGVGVNFGIPISESRKLSMGLSYERIALGVTVSPDPLLGSAQVAQDFVGIHGNTVYTLRGSVGWSQDTLNNFIFPTKGGLYSVNIEGGLPGADLQYYTTTLKASYYIPMKDERKTIRLRTQMSMGSGYGATPELPFFKNFYAGGAFSVRGYAARGLGPRDVLLVDQPIGGNRLVTANVEYFFPMPGSPNNGSSMRLSLFADAGMVYGANQAVDLNALRYSAGFAFNWFTPMFPISLSYAYPLNPQTGDRLERFQINIGLPMQ